MSHSDTAHKAPNDYSAYDHNVQRAREIVRDLQDLEASGRSLTSGTSWRTAEPSELANFKRRASDTQAEVQEILAAAVESLMPNSLD